LFYKTASPIVREKLVCEIAWDWTLKIYGPKKSKVAKDEEFVLEIYGIVINNPVFVDVPTI